MTVPEYLNTHRCYLIAALYLANEGDREILLKITQSEKRAFDMLKTAKIYQNFAMTLPVTDFPIFVSRDGQVTKMPERLFGYFLASKPFYKLPCDSLAEFHYDESFLKTLDLKDQDKLIKADAQIRGISS